ncbi:WD40-repeat-containing domain protein [Boletus edulis]|nr:WD40-repeat-containing domain protein [Boletus edulis]
MPRFLTGDELGNIKSFSYDPDASPENKLLLKTLHNGTLAGRAQGIQKLAMTTSSPTLLASAHADGTLCFKSLTGEDDLEQLHQWKETRFKADQSFVGLAATQNTVYSCASNGALRRTSTSDEVSLTHTLGALPSRLMDWRLGPDQETFAYGGDEVEVSIWNIERAFDSKKRKKAETLFPGEVWRAKNVANDYLGLRQPIHNTCLTYMSPSSSSHQTQILAGTRFGDLRRYDTRSGRRPVSDFKGVGKAGGVKSVENGLVEHDPAVISSQIFVSDQGTNVFAFDLRNGRVSYGYKGISGAVNSLAVAPSFLASVSLDRFTRIHSTFPPATEVGKQQEEKGIVLDKVYMTTVPTVVVWDQNAMRNPHANTKEDEGDVWEQMKRIEERNQE